MDEYKLQDIDLANSTLGTDGKKGKTLQQLMTMSHDLTKHLSADDASKIKVTALSVVKSRNGDGKDIKITTLRGWHLKWDRLITLPRS